MMKRIFLGIVFLASLAWVAYVGFDIASDKHNYDPERLFNGNDKSVLIVVRPDEVNFSNIEEFSGSPALELMHLLNDSIYDRGFFSLTRPHFLLIRESNWDATSVKSVFNSQTLQLIGSEEFTIGEYNGRFHKRNLYLSKGSIENQDLPESKFIFDQKASASIIRYADMKVKNTSDIYFKGSGRMNFITRDANIQQGNQVKDQELFAGVTTRNFKTYHFFERDYYATLDETFANGPMSKWMLNGFIELDYNGETVLISDFIGGQDPILILNDINQTLDTSRFSTQLTSTFPSSGNSYSIKYLEDAVVIAEKNETCDKILADYKLGNTIALNNEARYKVYGNLPKAVSERYVSAEEAFSKAVYHGKIMETHTGLKVENPATGQIAEEPIHMSCGFDIADFAELPGNGNIIALGKNGELTRFEKSASKWTKNLGSKASGEIQLIDLHGTGESFILLNTTDKIHLFNLSGDYINGFPIQLETDATNEVKFYRWKGRSYFLIANEDQKVVHFDAKGRELNIINVKMPVSNKIDVWASQQRVFAGFSGNKLFQMYDLDRKRMHREFDIPASVFPVKVPNQLFQFAIVDNKLCKFDQKGVRFDFQTYMSPQIKAVMQDKSNWVIVVKAANEINLVNTEGMTFGQIQLPFNEVEDIHVRTDDSGKTLVGIIDGLENNVYLYGTGGEKIVSKAFEGQLKVRLNSVSGQKRITTIVDQFVVQYFVD